MQRNDEMVKDFAEVSGTAAAPAGGNEYVPQSGAILGVLVQLNNVMVKDLAEVIAAVLLTPRQLAVAKAKGAALADVISNLPDPTSAT